MKMFLISDNIDTKTGMRLAGINGVIVYDEQEVRQAFQKAVEDPEIGIILITEKLSELIQTDILQIKLTNQTPLIVEIPDRYGTRRSKDSITRYVREAIGLKI